MRTARFHRATRVLPWMLAALLASVGASIASPVRPALDTPPPYRSGHFIHSGGLHTQADLDRMKAKVAAKETPWIEGWERLVADPLASADHQPAPRANMGVSRQRASKDAHAAYLNFIRGHISGDTRHIAAAIRICNAWSAAADQAPKGDDMPSLAGIPIAEFAIVGELLRSGNPPTSRVSGA